MEQGNYIKCERLQNKDGIKNAHPLILITLIRKLPLATLFYIIIESKIAEVHQLF